jgi:hypothetical protein
MGEKIKDFLFDISDTLITLFMIVLIVGVVTWKISDSMSYSNALEKAAPPVIESPVAETPPTGLPPESGTTGGTTGETAVNTPPVTTPPAANTPPAAGQKVTVVIQSGSTGYDIAKILVAKGLVKDTQTFIHRIEELKLGSKLKADTFEVASGIALDDLIKALTGQK